ANSKPWSTTGSAAAPSTVIFAALNKSDGLDTALRRTGPCRLSKRDEVAFASALKSKALFAYLTIGFSLPPLMLFLQRRNVPPPPHHWARHLPSCHHPLAWVSRPASHRYLQHSQVGPCHTPYGAFNALGVFSGWRRFLLPREAKTTPLGAISLLWGWAETSLVHLALSLLPSQISLATSSSLQSVASFEQVAMTSSDSSTSVRVVSPPGSGETSRSDPEVGSSGASSGPPSPVDARVLRDLEVMMSDHDLDTAVTEGSLAVIWSRGGYYLTARVDFRVSRAPSNNKGWKSRYLYVSGPVWGFRLDWSAHPIDNASPYLSEEETVLVGRLKGILSSSRAIKEMAEL
ncbi:hypothetical protein GW17_00060086, partial [Ensete ventricosum]